MKSTKERLLEAINIVAPLEDYTESDCIIRGVTISGIINPEIIGDNTDRSREVDSSRKLANWAVIPEFLDCYKDISYRITDAQGIVVKEDELTNCYVVEYIENFANENGTGKFKVVIRERGR